MGGISLTDFDNIKIFQANIMDDYFSGLIRPHIDEMKLDEEDWSNRRDSKESQEEMPTATVEEKQESQSEEAEDVAIIEETDLPASSITDEQIRHSTSTSSSSNEDSSREPSEGPARLTEFRAPMINYERDYPTQALVAVIGREFDEPWVVSSSLQALAMGGPIDGEPTGYPKMKFVPYTIRRSILVKGRLDPKDISKHDVICMCYNASEARILLTGTDGYYTQLLKHVEALLGTNRAAICITHYCSSDDKPQEGGGAGELISPELKKRLQAQPDLVQYLENDHVMSWYDRPHKVHISNIQSLANTETNPSGYIHCVLL